MEKIITWFDDMFKRMNLEPYVEKVGLTTHRLASGIVYFGVAFGLGFFFKRYFKFLVAWILIAALVYWVLHYNNLITLDVAGIKQFLGVSSIEQTGVDSTMHTVWQWMKSNVFLVICGGVGLFFGYQIG